MSRHTEQARELLRARGFEFLSSFVPTTRPERDQSIELWRSPKGYLAALHDYGDDGWNLYLDACPVSVMTADTIAALDEWSAS